MLTDTELAALAGITRPKGRVRIETLNHGMLSGSLLSITRPKGRVRIETAIRRVGHARRPRHHPAERPGAD